MFFFFFPIQIFHHRTKMKCEIFWLCVFLCCTSLAEAEATAYGNSNNNLSIFKEKAPTPSGHERCTCDAPNHCECCVSHLPVVNAICLNMTWYTENLTVVASLIINGLTVVTRTITDTHPLQICVNAGCTICVDMPRSEFNVTDTGACGRVFLNATCFGIYEKAWDLGTFYLGQNCTIPGRGEQDLIYLSKSEPVRLAKPLHLKDLHKKKEFTKVEKAKLYSPDQRQNTKSMTKIPIH